MAGTQGRRWAVVLMVVDVALLVVFAVLAVGHFRGTPDDPQSPPQTVAADDAVDFRMPSRRVACHMDAAGVVCGMNDVKIWPRVSGCLGDRVVVLDEAGARAVCATEVDVPRPDGAGRTSFGGAYFPSSVLSSDHELDYGQGRTVGGYTCESRRTGVLCRNADGQWFNLRQSDGFTQGGRTDKPPV
ncbi:MAG: hypothetical protein FWH11_11695 [Micrococcales bacterium]|nr:hypothetical protein [Micrococcales bacterium]